MENKETQDKIIYINQVEEQNGRPTRYYCKVEVPVGILIKFNEPTLGMLLNKLGHILIALTPNEERRHIG